MGLSHLSVYLLTPSLLLLARSFVTRDASSRESLVFTCYHEEWNGVRVGSFILEKFSSREVSKIHKYVLIFLFLCLYGTLRKLRKIAIF